MLGIGLGDAILIVISVFGGAWANSLYRGREVKKQEDRELRGLLGLILSEVVYNQTIVTTISDDATANVQEVVPFWVS